MLDVVVPMRSRRRDRAQLAQKLQHVMPAVPLLFQGVQGLLSGEPGAAMALGVVEIATSAMLLRATIVAVRQRVKGTPHTAHHAHAIDWMDVWTAGVLAAEVRKALAAARERIPPSPARSALHG